MDGNSLITAGAGLVGTVVGATLTWLISRRQQRLAATFRMHREFNSLEMIESRHQAFELVRTHHNKDFAHLRRTLGPVAMQDVWNVMYFYQRLWLAIEYRYVDSKHAVKLFGDVFYWWYDRSFSIQLIGLGTEPARHIEALHQWIDAHSTETDRRQWREGNANWALEPSKAL